MTNILKKAWRFWKLSENKLPIASYPKDRRKISSTIFLIPNFQTPLKFSSLWMHSYNTLVIFRIYYSESTWYWILHLRVASFESEMRFWVKFCFRSRVFDLGFPGSCSVQFIFYLYQFLALVLLVLYFEITMYAFWNASTCSKAKCLIRFPKFCFLSWYDLL